MLTIALAATLAHAIPPDCTDGSDTPTCSIELGYDCVVNLSGDTICVEIDQDWGPIKITGDGRLFAYRADGDVDLYEIERIVVENGADVHLWDDTPLDEQYAFELSSGSSAPSVQVLDASLTLDGAHVLGANPVPVLDIRGSSAVLVAPDGDLKMNGGRVSSGRSQYGAVFVDVDGSASFYETHFEDNDFFPPPWLFTNTDFKGRDIYSVGSLHLEGTVHDGTNAYYEPNVYGGSVYAAGSATIGTMDSPSTFTGYGATLGGAVLLQAGGPDGTTVDCGDPVVFAFVDGASADVGGAVAAVGCNSIDIGGTFVAEAAFVDGGAIALQNLGGATLHDLYVGGGTSASGYGGGVALFDVTTATVERATFEDTFATGGGGVYARSSDLTVDDSLFTGTDAYFGGAIAGDYAGSALVRGSAFCQTGQGYTAVDFVGPDLEVEHSWFQDSGSLLGSPNPSANHLTVVQPTQDPFLGSGSSWALSESLVDTNGRSAGDVTVSDSVVTGPSSGPPSALDVPIVFMDSVDGYEACSGGFRLDPYANDAQVIADPYRAADDWGAFGVAADDRMLGRLVNAPDGTTWGRDDDGDGWDNAVDCDIGNGNIHPSASELCNDGIDNDCDGLIDGADDDAVDLTWYEDGDGDGYGDAASGVPSCGAPGSGWTTTGGDCDDTNANIHPGVLELCANGIDEDCDGLVDGADDNWDTTTTLSVILDADGDGYAGEGNLPFPTCTPTLTQLPYDPGAPRDCDDTNSERNPGVPEICDGRENDCDGLTDTEDPDFVPDGIFYLDLDGDGYDDRMTQGWCQDDLGAYADPENPQAQLRAEASDDPDCDDADADVHPGAEEACDDGRDNDCDPATPDEPSLWFADSDGDGFGDPAAAQAACVMPAGHTLQAGDCNDSDGSVNPAATEQCGDETDNDCDPATSDLGDLDAWADGDGDGFGDPGAATLACSPDDDGVAFNDRDCDDMDPAVNPSATEVCLDGVDNDCDATTSDEGSVRRWADEDGDGLGDPDEEMLVCDADTPNTADNDLDCDDSAPDIGEALPYYVDGDDDLHGREDAEALILCPQEAEQRRDPRVVPSNDDCDDSNPTVYLGAPEIPDNGVDDDCRGGDAQSYVAGGCGACAATEPPALRSWPTLLTRRR